MQISSPSQPIYALGGNGNLRVCIAFQHREIFPYSARAGISSSMDVLPCDAGTRSPPPPGARTSLTSTEKSRAYVLPCCLPCRRCMMETNTHVISQAFCSEISMHTPCIAIVHIQCRRVVIYIVTFFTLLTFIYFVVDDGVSCFSR